MPEEAVGRWIEENQQAWEEWIHGNRVHRRRDWAGVNSHKRRQIAQEERLGCGK